MYCVKDGKVCVMLWDESKHDWVYIPEMEYRKHEKLNNYSLSLPNQIRAAETVSVKCYA